MTRPALVLHVGHPKTGSSALQSQLAVSVEALAGLGVAYPWHKAMARARKGHTSTGNVDPRRILESYENAVRDNPSATRILFSNEALMPEFTDSAEPFERLVTQGITVEMILFIRNPFSHALSQYGQEVKRGRTDGVKGILEGFSFPQRVAKFITSQRRAGVQLQIANYSNHAGQLAVKFCDMLSIPAETLQSPKNMTVNRSLTPSEIYIQSRFNEAWGPRSNAFIAEQLCNILPDLNVPPVRVGKDDFMAFRDRMAPMIERVNPMLPENEQYQLEDYDAYYDQAEEAGDIRLTEEQVTVLAAAISTRLPRLELTDAYFDLVERLRAGGSLTVTDIDTLTDMARALRPGTERLNEPVVPRDRDAPAGLLAQIAGKFRGK